MLRLFSSRTLIPLLSGVLLMVVMMGSTGCAALKIKASVAGYVYLNNRPMPNFQVQLISGNKVIAFEKTNQQGHYIITDVPPGDYTVQVLTYASTPFAGYEGNIHVRPGRTENLDIDLGGKGIPELKRPGK